MPPPPAEFDQPVPTVSAAPGVTADAPVPVGAPASAAPSAAADPPVTAAAPTAVGAIPRQRGAGPLRPSTAPRGGARRRWPLLAAVLLPFTALVVGSAFLPWEWSFIDDGNMISRVRAAQQAEGWLPGVWGFAVHGWRSDVAWGLFRPLFWVWVPLFYQLPVGAAHAVRVAALLLTVAGAMAATGRRFAGWDRWAVAAWAGAAVAVDTSLYAGLYYPSLQELSGLSLVALGLLVRRRPLLRLLAFVGAAWFKAPFAWLLVGYGLLLLRRRGTRRLGAAYTAVGTVTLGVLALVAREGVYARSALTFTGHTLLANLNTAVGAAAWAGVLLVVGAVLFGARWDLGVGDTGSATTGSATTGSTPTGSTPTGSTPTGSAVGGSGTGGAADPIALALVVGGLGYLANLIFWKTGGYYASGYLYLLTVGLLLGVRSVGPLRPVRLLAGALVPVLLAVPVVRTAAKDVWGHNETVVGLRDCLLSLPGAPTVGYNRHEAWQRLDFIVREHRPDWGGRVLLVEDGATVSTRAEPVVTRFDYYIRDTGYGPGTPSLMTGPVVCTAPNEIVYQVLS